MHVVGEQLLDLLFLQPVAAGHVALHQQLTRQVAVEALIELLQEHLGGVEVERAVEQAEGTEQGDQYRGELGIEGLHGRSANL